MSGTAKTSWYMTGEELVTVGSDLHMDYANTYAQLNRFDWRN